MIARVRQRFVNGVAAALTVFVVTAPALASEDSRVAAFREVCEAPGSFEDLSRRARDARWAPAHRSVFTPAMPGDEQATFSRWFGHTVMLTLTRHVDPDGASLTCTLFDLEGDELSPEMLSEWLGAPLSASAGLGPTIWRPDLPGVMSVNLTVAPITGAGPRGHTSTSLSLTRILTTDIPDAVGAFRDVCFNFDPSFEALSARLGAFASAHGASVAPTAEGELLEASSLALELARTSEGWRCEVRMPISKEEGLWSGFVDLFEPEMQARLRSVTAARLVSDEDANRSLRISVERDVSLERLIATPRMQDPVQ